MHHIAKYHCQWVKVHTLLFHVNIKPEKINIFISYIYISSEKIQFFATYLTVSSFSALTSRMYQFSVNGRSSGAQSAAEISWSRGRLCTLCPRTSDISYTASDRSFKLVKAVPRMAALFMMVFTMDVEVILVWFMKVMKILPGLYFVMFWCMMKGKKTSKLLYTEFHMSYINLSFTLLSLYYFISILLNSRVIEICDTSQGEKIQIVSNYSRIISCKLIINWAPFLKCELWKVS